MKLGISHKLGTLTALLLIAVSGIVGVVVWWMAINLLIEHEKVDLRDETLLTGNKVLIKIATMREDVLALSAHPAIDRIIELKQSPDVDDAELNQARQRLADAFKRVCEGEADEEMDDKHYLQIRFIGKDGGGREIVRIQREVSQDERDDVAGDFSGKRIDFVSVRFDELDAPDSQQYVKGQRPYFKSLHDKFGDEPDNSMQHEHIVTMSEVEINKEQDPVTGNDIIPRNDAGEPILQPVLRASIPVFDRKGEFFGIVIINLDFSELQGEILTGGRHLVYLTNAKGQFLVHPQDEQAYSHEKRELVEFADIYSKTEEDSRIQSYGPFKDYWGNLFQDKVDIELLEDTEKESLAQLLEDAEKGSLAKDTVRPDEEILLKRLRLTPKFNSGDADGEDWSDLRTELRRLRREQLRLEPGHREHA